MVELAVTPVLEAGVREDVGVRLPLPVQFEYIDNLKTHASGVMVTQELPNLLMWVRFLRGVQNKTGVSYLYLVERLTNVLGTRTQNNMTLGLSIGELRCL